MTVEDALEKLRIAVAFAKQMLAAYEACKCLECRIAEGDYITDAEEGPPDTCTAAAVYDAANRHAVDSAILYLAALDAKVTRCADGGGINDTSAPVAKLVCELHTGHDGYCRMTFPRGGGQLMWSKRK